MSSTPLVSCIMPTRNRRAFVAQSIWYFLRQDYGPRELLVLDDGDDAIEDLVPDDDRIRYVRVQPGSPLSTKRNLGGELCRGELIAHWDDGDWIAHDRLSRQVAGLESSSADICGAEQLLHYRLDAGEAWLHRPPPEQWPHLESATLLYRRSVWHDHRFALRPDAVEAFVRSVPPERIHADGESDFYIGVIDPASTGGRDFSRSEWERRPLDDVVARLGFDAAFYVEVRNGGASSSRAPATTSNVTVAAPFLVYDGYGSMAEYLVRGMRRAGAAVDLMPLALDRAGLSDELRDVLAQSKPSSSGPLLFCSWARRELDQLLGAREVFLYTMWETSRLPHDWTPRFNRAQGVIVPTRFVARVCRESGVDAPIEVVPLGVDPAVYHLEQRPEREGLTTLVVATVVERKNTLVAIEAWKRAFADDPSARLILKSRFHYESYTPDDPRIQIVDANETTRGIAHWYRRADILLALGNEGFGLPLVEGMATGLPVVALDSEGQGDVCSDARDLVLPVKPARWVAYQDAVYGRGGVRGVPDADEVADRLRWVAGHRDEARELGRAASAWVHEHRDVWTTGPAVLDVLEQRVSPPRPLRRRRTMWVPSWRTPCGVAEYTRHLTESLADVQVADRAPDLRGASLLHIQHEYSLFADADLDRLVAEAAASRVPIALTEHSVDVRARSWERGVDLLVTTTAEAAARLRARWPNAWVEHVPHGCPTWFPPRKRRRGRVIGSFGFLSGYKGFWTLLDVLRELPGTELLLFSHAKGPAEEEEWAKASAGLPVRRVSEFLPSEEVARRLAAEADVLVYWYEDTAFASASGAVRVGLASGVPVLASPTSWFSELRDVTYQPENLVEGVSRLLEETPLRKRLTAAARELCEAHSWPRTADRHRALWRTLEQL